MNQDLSIVSLVIHASFIVQVVIGLLLLSSLASWSVIFGKFFSLSKIKSGNDTFEQEFWFYVLFKAFVARGGNQFRPVG